MSEHISNLLIGTEKTVNKDTYWMNTYATTEPLVVGTTYTISAYVEELECDGKTPKLNIFDGGGYWGAGNLRGDIPGVCTLTFVYKQRADHADPNHIKIINTYPYNGEKRKAVFNHLMLVKGDTPVAWAPAEGETLTADAGGGRCYE